MRTVFFGTSAFAVPSLHALAACSECVLVVTQPDRPAGRGQRLQPTAVKLTALELGIPVIEPQRLTREAAPELFAQAFDLFVVTSYGKIVPQAVLDLPRLGALNVHPSLLPLYRGATPLQSQLRDGVTESGVTLMVMDAGMDTGDIVLREHSLIEEHETYGELHDRFAETGARLLREALACGGVPSRTAQRSLMQEARACETLTKPLRKDDLRIEACADRTMRGIVNHIRSLAPEPGARVDVESFGIVKVLTAHAFPEGPPAEVAPGCALAIAGNMFIRATDGWVLIDTLVPPGKRAMTREAFRRGNPLTSKPYEKIVHTWHPQNAL